MRKIYRMMLELGLAAALAIPEIVLMIVGGDIYNGTVQLSPESIMTMQQMHGAVVMVLGWSLLNTVCMGLVANSLSNYKKKIAKLEDEIHGMDQEAAEES